MSTEQWSADQLGALADEWAAEREAFLSAVQTYLARQLSQGPAGQPQSLAPALYDAELAAIGERLSSFLHTLDSTPRYTIQHRVAEYQQTLETQYGAAAEADAARLAAIQPPPAATALHDAVRQALAIMQHILHLYKELRGQFDFATVRFANRLASQIKYRLYPVRQHVPALLHYWLWTTRTWQPASQPPPMLTRTAVSGATTPRGPWCLHLLCARVLPGGSPLAIIADAARGEWQRRGFCGRGSNMPKVVATCS